MRRGDYVRTEPILRKNGKTANVKLFSWICDECNKVVIAPGYALQICECEMPSKTCVTCGKTYKKTKNISMSQWEKSSFCSKYCAGNDGAIPVEGIRRESDINENLSKIKNGHNELDKTDIDKKKCCANCAIYDTVYCKLPYEKNVSSSFDMFEFVCDDFYFYRG